MKAIFFLIFQAHLFISAAVGQDQWKNVYRESAWGERDKWQRADELIRRLTIKEGSQVADIGCNEGYMTVKLSGAVAAQGKVYAVDINQSKLNLLKNHLADRKISNVILVKGDYDNPKLPSNALDAVIILDSYHEMQDHDEILKHIKVSLRSGGRVLLCEPIAEDRRKLARSEQEQKHELGINYALADLKKAGFDIVYQKDSFVDRSRVKGDMMWVIVAVKR